MGRANPGRGTANFDFGDVTGGGDKPSANYTWVENATTGNLELKRGTSTAAVIGVDGSEFAKSVKTGVGSFHLGTIHSIGSSGKAVVFHSAITNTCILPVSHKTIDYGATIEPAFQVLFGDLTTLDINSGLHMSTAATQAITTYTPSGLMAVFGVEFASRETYNGKLTLVITDNVTGVEIFRFTSQTVTLALNQQYTIHPNYSVYADPGRAVSIKIVKEDGFVLNVRRSSAGASFPWFRIHYRPYTKEALIRRDEVNTLATNKVDKVAGKQLSDENYTAAEKTKLAGIPDGGGGGGGVPSEVVNTTCFSPNWNGAVRYRIASDGLKTMQVSASKGGSGFTITEGEALLSFGNGLPSGLYPTRAFTLMVGIHGLNPNSTPAYKFELLETATALLQVDPNTNDIKVLKLYGSQKENLLQLTPFTISYY